MGWNDPPKMDMNAPSSISGHKRPRARVFHSVDGRGGSCSASNAMPSSYTPATSAFPYQMQSQTFPQNQMSVNSSSDCQPVQQPAVCQPTDLDSLSARLGNHISAVFGNPSIEVIDLPSKFQLMNDILLFASKLLGEQCIQLGII